MNTIYNIVWNHSLMAWTVVSELGKGKVKSSFSKGTSYNGIKSTLIIAPALLIIAGGVSAHDVSGIVYTDGSSFTFRR